MATSGDIEPLTGGYWYHQHVQHPHPAAKDAACQAEVIAALEAHTGVTLG
ncbi:MAG: hypothetical protein JO352_32145 [Chloroflexi bacterium]|nr:hypothetical protein [Chloroflexota bacterium]MBV9598582.1 hypothetical protein [Chloroflexota bacterium]